MNEQQLGIKALAACFDRRHCCRFNAAEGKHLVEYDDGEKEWLDLPAELVSPAQTGLPGCSGLHCCRCLPSILCGVYRGLCAPGCGRLQEMICSGGRRLHVIERPVPVVGHGSGCIFA